MRGSVINRGKYTKSKKQNWGYVLDMGYDTEGKRKKVIKSGFITKQVATDAPN